jgi:ubiquinol-cytochrome c reductase cytochrome c1 subunit
MKKVITTIALLLTSALVQASGDSLQLLKADIDIHDKASLRNGAKIYMDHCAACHAAKYMRFERIAMDLDFSEEQTNELMRFGVEKTHEPIKALIAPEMGAMLFGIAPPDLSLVAKYRGEDWLYTYLMTFTEDETTSTGYNNKVMPNVAMPWALANVQASLERRSAAWKAERQQAMKDRHLHQLMKTEPASFATEMRDLTNFMAYMAEPIRPYRERAGKYVLLFLLVLLVPVWLLKNEYWKDVH